MEAIIIFAVITFANIGGVTAFVENSDYFNEAQPQGQVEVMDAQAASNSPESNYPVAEVSYQVGHPKG